MTRVGFAVHGFCGITQPCLVAIAPGPVKQVRGEVVFREHRKTESLVDTQESSPRFPHGLPSQKWTQTLASGASDQHVWVLSYQIRSLLVSTKLPLPRMFFMNSFRWKHFTPVTAKTNSQFQWKSECAPLPECGVTATNFGVFLSISACWSGLLLSIGSYHRPSLAKGPYFEEALCPTSPGGPLLDLVCSSWLGACSGGSRRLKNRAVQDLPQCMSPRKW